MKHYGSGNKGKQVRLFHGLILNEFVRIPSHYRFSCHKSAKGTCYIITRRGKPMPTALNT